jgi:hypothetical protein
MERAATDDEFRGRVLTDTAAALSEYHLGPDDQARVLDSVQMVEGEIQPEAAALEEVEAGQADAAGVKG